MRKKAKYVVRIIRITSSFFSSTNGELSEIDKNIRKVWETEDVSNMMRGKWKKYEEEYVLNEAVSKLTERIITYDGTRYEIKVSWKTDPRNCALTIIMKHIEDQPRWKSNSRKVQKYVQQVRKQLKCI